MEKAHRSTGKAKISGKGHHVENYEKNPSQRADSCKKFDV